MSYNNLKRFVKQQALKGEDPVNLREGLILNGWAPEDVDKVISEVYGLKNKIRTTSIVIIVLLVIIFSISLLLVFNKYNDDVDDVDDIVDRNASNDLIIVNDDSCEFIEDISLKEDCYLKKIESGFSCEDLSNAESFYCNRVLEIYLLDAFS